MKLTRWQVVLAALMLIAVIGIWVYQAREPFGRPGSKVLVMTTLEDGTARSVKGWIVRYEDESVVLGSSRDASDGERIRIDSVVRCWGEADLERGRRD